MFAIELPDIHIFFQFFSMSARSEGQPGWVTGSGTMFTSFSLVNIPQLFTLLHILVFLCIVARSFRRSGIL